MVRAALTGGIATGKSFCLARFAELGVATVDADLLARDAVAPGSPGLAGVNVSADRTITSAQYGTCFSPSRQSG